MSGKNNSFIQNKEDKTSKKSISRKIGGQFYAVGIVTMAILISLTFYLQTGLLSIKNTNDHQIGNTTERDKAEKDNATPPKNKKTADTEKQLEATNFVTNSLNMTDDNDLNSAERENTVTDKHSYSDEDNLCDNVRKKEIYAKFNTSMEEENNLHEKNNTNINLLKGLANILGITKNKFYNENKRHENAEKSIIDNLNKQLEDINCG